MQENGTVLVASLAVSRDLRASVALPYLQMQKLLEFLKKL